MLKFKEKIIMTGIERRVSKQGKEYIIINYLGENGQTFGTIAECYIPDDLNQLEKVEVDFQVIPGRYTQLKTVGIRKVG